MNSDELMELCLDDDESDAITGPKLFVLREKKTTIYPFDYKYKLSESSYRIATSCLHFIA